TVVTTELRTHRLRKNVIDCLREVCWGETSIARSMCPTVPLEAIRELVVNAYVHRCYRTQGPILLKILQSGIVIENPGELPAGLNADSLIHCVPVYRNLLLADGARIFGLCDM